jgi:ATP-dependent Zn protease
MSNKRIAAICAVLLCAAGFLWWIGSGQRSLATLSYSRFLEEVQSGQVASVVVFGGNSGAIEATCQLKDGKTVRTVLPWDYRDALQAMQDKLVNIEIRNSPAPSRIFWNSAPFLALLALWIALMISKSPNGMIGGIRGYLR